MRTQFSCAILFFSVLCTASYAPAQSDEPQNVERDLQRVRLRAPRLRINAGGHHGIVQALAFTPDSARLCSAGVDKDVHVWNLSLLPRDLQRRFLRERVLRWQIARGPRGMIYSTAMSPRDGLLAMAGYAADGGLGQIWLVDPVGGKLDRVLESHTQTIGFGSLCFSSDGNWLASSDTFGKTVLWNRAGWNPVVLYDEDAKTYGAEKARLIQSQPKLRPITIVGNSHVVVPVYVGQGPGGRLRWQLQYISLANRKNFQTLPTIHEGVVTALAASPDGRRFASADWRGNLYLWDAANLNEPQQLQPAAIVRSLAFHPQRDQLVAGTFVSGRAKKGQVQVWDLQTKQIDRRRLLDDHVSDCRISPDGKWLAYAGGQHNQVFVEPWDAPQKRSELRGKGDRIWKVAFERGENSHRIAFGTTYRDGGFNDHGPLQQTFDPATSAVGNVGQLEAGKWIAPTAHRGGWRASYQDGKLQLSRQGAAKGFVALDPHTEGRARCYCWIPDAQGNPYAIAVGTDTQNSLYVYRLAERGPCPLLRHFRGHHDFLTSVGISGDRRYLVSGAADGTIRVWSLADLQEGTAPAGRLGAALNVAGGKLVVGEMHPAGPLFGKGVRQGDEINRIRWYDEQGQQQSAEPAGEILNRLQSLPWTAQIVFETSRQGNAREPFQLLPAWPPLATLFVTRDREWAFWTPEGYYDASTNGHTMFGWQVNRGWNRLPDFYRADQFHRRLERPDVMQKLLSAGNLTDAFRLAQTEAPAAPERVLPEQVAATPQVDILAPAPGTALDRPSATVRARVVLPKQGKLEAARVFANGVVGSQAKIISQQEVEEGTEIVYEWQVGLPSDSEHLIQVVVGTDHPTSAFKKVVVSRKQAAPRQRAPKLYLLAVGINQFRDDRIQPLAYSVADAQAVTKLLKARAKKLFQFGDVRLLTNQNVTRENWRTAFADLHKELKATAQPDDLLIVFLAGHGFVDQGSKRYYFATHDLDVQDFKNGNFDECISWKDFELLADIPCRKLAVLDTCHSGAIQPLAAQNLKAAVRAFQDDIIFTVTASTGDEKSAENPAWGHGAFTKCLLEGLRGQADDSADGYVSLQETIDYVKRAVPELTGGQQHPTAGPNDLLPYVSLRLTPADETGAE